MCTVQCALSAVVLWLSYFRVKLLKNCSDIINLGIYIPTYLQEHALYQPFIGCKKVWNPILQKNTSLGIAR